MLTWMSKLPATAGAKGKAPTGTPVRLAECRDDLRLIAADGPGSDAGWKKKGEYR